VSRRPILAAIGREHLPSKARLVETDTSLPHGVAPLDRISDRERLALVERAEAGRAQALAAFREAGGEALLGVA